MSWKSLGFSILSLIITVGLLLLTIFLFMLHLILGIIGIVLLIVIPQITMRKARDEASGLIDRLIAKYIMPIGTVVCAGFVLLVVFGLIPNPFV